MSSSLLLLFLHCSNQLNNGVCAHGTSPRDGLNYVPTTIHLFQLEKRLWRIQLHQGYRCQVMTCVHSDRQRGSWIMKEHNYIGLQVLIFAELGMAIQLRVWRMAAHLFGRSGYEASLTAAGQVAMPNTRSTRRTWCLTDIGQRLLATATNNFPDNPSMDMARPTDQTQNAACESHFAANKVEQLIKDVLEAYLRRVRYEPCRCSRLCQDLCSIIKGKTKELSSDPSR